MSLHLADKWIWDPWFAHVNGDWHLFYLQAPRDSGPADQRHWHVSIGHAFSHDLLHWEILPDALGPSQQDPEAWDSYTTWTGSVIQHAGHWYLFYTGGSRAEEGRVQRIGFATSQDLLHWEKYEDNPVLVGDEPPYEQLDLDQWHEHAWRDPWVFRHPEERSFHALITARIDEGPPDGRGVIAHARSSNLIDWEVLPPLTAAGFFGHMEVPQLFSHQGEHYLLFGVVRKFVSHESQRRATDDLLTGIYYSKADAPLGPFLSGQPQLLLGDQHESFYAGKLLQDPSGQLVYLPALYKGTDGQFVGALADPLDVSLSSIGELQVEAPPDPQAKER